MTSSTVSRTGTAPRQRSGLVSKEGLPPEGFESGLGFGDTLNAYGAEVPRSVGSGVVMLRWFWVTGYGLRGSKPRSCAP